MINTLGPSGALTSNQIALGLTARGIAFLVGLLIITKKPSTKTLLGTASLLLVFMCFLFPERSTWSVALLSSFSALMFIVLAYEPTKSRPWRSVRIARVLSIGLIVSLLAIPLVLARIHWLPATSLATILLVGFFAWLFAIRAPEGD